MVKGVDLKVRQLGIIDALGVVQNSLKLVAKCSPHSRRKKMNLCLLEKGERI